MSPEPTADVAWYHKPVWIAVLAFLVLGPFALPLVWRSPAIGENGRILWTIGILVWTALLFWQTFEIANQVASQIQLQHP